MSRESSPEFVRAMGPVARKLLGEPTKENKAKRELRFNQRFSLSVNLEDGTWFDHEANQGGGVLDFVQTYGAATDKDSAVAWLRGEGHLAAPTSAKAGGKRQIVAYYDYISADDELLFQVIRYEPKAFSQRRPDGEGRWINKMDGVERVLYRLPQVMAAVAAGLPVFVVEGEKAAEALAQIGVPATCSPGGANKWRASYSKPLTGADVVILPDNDDTGRDHAAAVAKELRGVARSVRIVALPGLLEKGDAADWIAAGGTREALEALLPTPSPDADAEAAPNPKPMGERKSKATLPNASDSNGPLIRVVSGELHLTATAGEKAIRDGGLPIYQRGDTLVRPLIQDVPAARGRMTVSASLMGMNVYSMIDTLCSCAVWEKYNARAQAWLRIDPPKPIADTILSRAGMWTLPQVVGVITTPTIRPNGTILSDPGYDPDTRLYHVADPDVSLTPSVQNPTKHDAEQALKVLLDLLTEFPFTSDVGRAVALSGLITPVTRGALTVAPMHVYRASTAGSGKSYLVDTCSAIAGGRPCPVAAAGPDEIETEKRLTGLLLSGFPLISLDNVNGELGGDLLCQAIERPLIRVRRLGASDITEIESRATLFATGNALRVRGDMTRRTLLCDLDANMERPELRVFKADPIATIMTDRGRYISACLVIVRAYFLAGLPGKLPPLASFSDWSDLVRSTLVWLGCADPASSMEAAREDDPELSELREVVTAWRDALVVGEAMTVKELADAAECHRTDDLGITTQEYSRPELREALHKIAGERGTINTKRLGNWLAKNAGRIVGGHRIAKGGDTASGGLIRWRLINAKMGSMG
jgi:putative DNA primase/helicase